MAYRIYPLSNLRPYGVTYRRNQERVSQQPPRFSSDVAQDYGYRLFVSPRASPKASPNAFPKTNANGTPGTGATTSISNKRKTPPTNAQSSPTGPVKKTKCSNDDSQTNLPGPAKSPSNYSQTSISRESQPRAHTRPSKSLE